MSEEKMDTNAFAVPTKPSSLIDDKDKGTICKHCQSVGHASESCYVVIGYPEWWGDRPRS